MRLVTLLAVTLFMFGCATARPTPPAGYSFELVTRDDFGIEVQVPDSWEAGEYHGGICSFDVKSPGERVFIRIIILTEWVPERAHEYTANGIVEGARREGYVLEPVKRVIDGCSVEGAVTVGRDPEEWILVVRHPNWVYLLNLRIQGSATAQEREVAFYILDQLKFHGVNFPELEAPDEENLNSNPSYDEMRSE